MPKIKETISEYETDILMMIAENWGMDLEIDPGKDLASQISRMMLEKENASEIIEVLPASASRALVNLMQSNGRLPWERFIKKYGDIREMGAARREKEHPGRNPVSETERLYYSGLIGRAFFDSGGGPKEFAYIPDELMRIIRNSIPGEGKKSQIPLAKKQRLLAVEPSDHVIDDAVTLLAELRKKPDLKIDLSSDTDIPAEFMMLLFLFCGIIDNHGHLDSSRIKDFFELDRPNALLFLTKAWKGAKILNELDFIDNLEVEGGWKNDPAHSRGQILQVLEDVPEGKWIRLEDLISWFQDNSPDILRNRGDFESWLISNPENGKFLRGFENWEKVEGRYLSYFVEKACWWFMLVELGRLPDSNSASHFRTTPHLKKICGDKAPDYKYPQQRYFTIEETGRLIMERFFPLDVRYQIARFCRLEQTKGDKYIYRITPGSLDEMRAQELKVSQLLSLIKRYGKKPIPENIPAALKRWDARKMEASLENKLILRVQDSEVLERLMRSAAKEYILEKISPTDAIIKKGCEEIMNTALIKMGILVEINPEV